MENKLLIIGIIIIIGVLGEKRLGLLYWFLLGVLLSYIL